MQRNTILLFPSGILEMHHDSNSIERRSQMDKYLSNSQFWKTKPASKLTEFCLIDPNINAAEPRKDGVVCFQADRDNVTTD